MTNPEQGANMQLLIDVPALELFVNSHVPGAPGPITVEKHTAGYSNETFYVTRGEERFVLRRPPRGPLLPTAHDVVREYRFLAALNGRARVPEAIALCEDGAVIGAPFYLMRRVEGVVPRFEVPAGYDNPAGYLRMTEELVDTLVELHGVDWRRAGLPGKEEGYLHRQLARWGGQWELTRPRTRALPGLDDITAWLRHHLPESPAATIVHGDYKFDNVMFDAREPRLIAIFDWEMATIGDPLADVGYLLDQWTPSPAPAADPPQPSSIVRLMDRPGFPGAAAVAAMYEAKSGRSLRHLLFYRVLAQYKLAVILEGLYMHYIEGTAANDLAAEFEWRVPSMVAATLQLIASEGDAS